jgi:hypothetical protein
MLYLLGTHTAAFEDNLAFMKTQGIEGAVADFTLKYAMGILLKLREESDDDKPTTSE